MESNAATAIQRLYRGHRVRRIGRTLHTAATTIQAAFRGFLTRKRFSLIIQTNREIEDHEYRLHSIQSRLSRHEKDMQLLKGTHREKISQVSLEWLNKAATVVQKVYRGYYTRKMLKGVNHQGKRKTLSTRRTTHPRPKQTVKFESDTINDLEESDIEASHQDIVATSDEGDIAVAREQVIHRLETVRQSKNTHKERETAANLLANLNIAQRLLNNYYDSVDDSDFCVDNTLKFSPQDITLGCKSLRLRTEDYLEALLDCDETLDGPSELIFNKKLVASSDKSRVRMDHLHSLKDGKMRWWEFDLNSTLLMEELMDLDMDDVEKSCREY